MTLLMPRAIGSYSSVEVTHRITGNSRRILCPATDNSQSLQPLRRKACAGPAASGAVWQAGSPPFSALESLRQTADPDPARPFRRPHGMMRGTPSFRLLVKMVIKGKATSLDIAHGVGVAADGVACAAWQPDGQCRNPPAHPRYRPPAELQGRQERLQPALPAINAWRCCSSKTRPTTTP